ncbi:MAG: hypothetical protein G01um101429_756 [Parcubacteria group bacterium Gr01-1014_29]|nr:MAG: hypothetical protein G01um101429_756 [Parcubacteria group bacterium Gr01-1014_29]
MFHMKQAFHVKHIVASGHSVTVAPARIAQSEALAGAARPSCPIRNKPGWRMMVVRPANQLNRAIV